MFKQIIRSWFKSISNWFKEALTPHDEERMREFEKKINKMMGIPPADKLCEKNPYRFM